MKRKIVPHGYLKKLVPEGLELSGNTVTEILNGVSKQVPGLRRSPKTGKHVLQVVGFNSIESLTKPLTDDVTELHVVPAMFGGKGGFFKIVLGAMLIAAAFYTAGASAILTGNAGFWASTAFVMGTTLVLGGLLELVSPTPKMDKDSDDASKYLGASGNTIKIGTRIGLAYGELMLFGHILSFNINATHTAINPSSDYISWKPHERNPT